MPRAADDANFQVDPAQYILGHACTFLGFEDPTDGPKQFTEWTRAACGSSGKRYLDRRNVPWTPVLTTPSICPNVPTIRLVGATAPGGKRVTYLPWEESKATVSHISTGDDLFFTGPLSGCQIYYAEKTGFPPLVFHINANNDIKSPARRFDFLRFAETIKKRDLSHNIAVKDAEADRIANQYGYTIRGRKARGEYVTPAFAWGRRVGATWELYLHDVNPDAGFAYRNERIF